MRREVSGEPPSHKNAASIGSHSERELERDHEDHQGEWAREEQQVMIFFLLMQHFQVLSLRQMMIREQDRTIDSIAGTLSTLAQQAGLMGREIGEQVEYVSIFTCDPK
jgi:hypothetical protein